MAGDAAIPPLGRRRLVGRTTRQTFLPVLVWMHTQAREGVPTMVQVVPEAGGTRMLLGRRPPRPLSYVCEELDRWHGFTDPAAYYGEEHKETPPPGTGRTTKMERSADADGDDANAEASPGHVR